MSFRVGDRVYVADDDGPRLVVAAIHPESADTVGGLDLSYGGAVVRYMVDPADLTPAD